MGRPLNKRYFGTGSGNQLKVRFKTGGTEYDGYILSQRSTKKFKVTDGTHTAICSLVNKTAGTLANGEMSISLLTDTGVLVQATKMFNRTMIIEGSQKVKWNFATSTSDGAVQAPEEASGALALEITIDTQPVDDSVTSPASATFTVVASGVGDLAYQWECNNGDSSWEEITGATAASLTVASTADEYVDGNLFRVVVSSTSGAAPDVVSDEVTLTVA